MPIYMKYESIAGTAGGARKDWIVLESCQFGSHKAAAGNERTGGIKISDIEVTKLMDASSPHFATEMFNGKPRKVFIEYTKTEKEKPYMILEMDGTLITRYSNSNSRTGKNYETMTLNFDKLTATY